MVIRFFYASLHFDTKILVIRKVVLREQDENKSPRTQRKVECSSLASVSFILPWFYSTVACIFNWLKNCSQLAVNLLTKSGRRVIWRSAVYNFITIRLSPHTLLRLSYAQLFLPICIKTPTFILISFICRQLFCYQH